MKFRICAWIAAGFVLGSCTGEGVRDPVSPETDTIEIADVGPVSSPEGIALTLDPDDGLAPGDAVTLILGNGTGTAVGYNLCLSGLLVRSGEEWQPLPSDEVCTLELRNLLPGAEARYGSGLPESLEPGIYRFWTVVDLRTSEPQVSAITAPFPVE